MPVPNLEETLFRKLSRSFSLTAYFLSNEQHIKLSMPGFERLPPLCQIFDATPWDDQVEVIWPSKTAQHPYPLSQLIRPPTT